MTEEQWLAATDTNEMLLALEGKATDRKRRLFACAAAEWLRCEFAADWWPDVSPALDTADGIGDLKDCPGVVEVTSPHPGTFYRRRPTDRKVFVTVGSIVAPKRVLCLLELMRLYNEIGPDCHGVVADMPVEPGTLVQYGEVLCRVLVTPAFEPTHLRTAAELASRVRCIFGNPLSPAQFDPAWRTETVVLLGREMYQSRDFSGMPVMADALEESGCQDRNILSHCRGTGPHARGCHVVDAVLGRE